MITGIALTALLVRDYDDAIAFYCGKLGFVVVEDTKLEKKRWVRIRAPGNQGSEILLSKAEDEKQTSVIGNQAGGRVLFFMHTDDFESDYEKFKSLGVKFLEGPRKESYGTIAVFSDLYGNRIDLIQPLP
ncbi:MAG: VOC family protein [Xanthomonadaceae bacterium]|nr:VOC family protein [Xanthomonadaceae bacterium]